MHSSIASPIVSNTTKSFMRLNTEKSRSVDRRPILAKAQSIAASAAAMMSSSNAGSELNSPSHGFSNNNEMFNGRLHKMLVFPLNPFFILNPFLLETFFKKTTK